MAARHTRLDKTRDSFRTHGLLRTIHRCAYSVIKHYYPYMTMNCLSADARNLIVPAESLPYEARFLTQAELLHFARDGFLSADGFTEALVPVLLRNGDQCFGILDQRRLVAFCWYCVNPPARINDLWALEFSRGAVYLYFVYTHPRYRGRSLFPHGLKLAAHEYSKRGLNDIVAFVEFANYSSLAAFRRMGFQQFGRMRITRAFARNIPLGGRGCDRFGFRIVPNPNPLVANPQPAAGAAKPAA